MKRRQSAGSDGKRRHADLEAGRGSEQAAPSAKEVILTLPAELEAQVLPVCHPAEGPPAVVPPSVATAAAPSASTDPAGVTAAANAVIGASVPAVAADLSRGERRVASGTPAAASEEAAAAGAAACIARESGSARQQEPALAWKRSVRFADDDPVAVRGKFLAAAIACSGIAESAGRRRDIIGDVTPAAGAAAGAFPLPSSTSDPQLAFCWGVLDAERGVPEGTFDSLPGFGGAGGINADGEEDPIQGLLPRRSVDVRMADAATLPMAAFGGNGMETSSAVLRNFMASHEAS